MVDAVETVEATAVVTVAAGMVDVGSALLVVSEREAARQHAAIADTKTIVRETTTEALAVKSVVVTVVIATDPGLRKTASGVRTGT